MPKTEKDLPTPPKSERLKAIWDAAEIYGTTSFDNYAQIRSIAEAIRDELCAWLDSERQCVFLVPPEGAFTSQNYRSAAFSVSGKGYLPLKPIRFGLAIQVSESKDYMRVVMTCRKEGDAMFIALNDQRDMRVNLPATKEGMTPLFENIYGHMVGFFADSVEEYENGNYGNSVIGFDIERITD